MSADKVREARPIFAGFVKISCLDGGESTEVEIDATCDAAGLGVVLGVAARQHLQNIPEAARGREFESMLAAFVFNAVDRVPVTVIAGSTEMIPVAENTQGEKLS